MIEIPIPMLALCAVVAILWFRDWSIRVFKVSYYETRMDNNGLKDTVRDMRFRDIWRGR